MSMSHHFTISTELKKFPNTLLDALRKILEEKNYSTSKYTLTEEDILVKFGYERPEYFFITTNPELTDLKLLDKGLYTFINYHNNISNEVLCILAITCKYFLKDKFFITSDGFYDGIDFSWKNAQKYVNSKGYNIKLEYEKHNETPKIWVDGILVENVFDKDKSIFNAIFIPYTKDKI